MPKFSIVVPVYGAEDYFRECVDSILSQDFQDLELILVDDASPDGCPLICDEYAQKDKRVKTIHQENQGISGASNTGIQACTGEYMIQVDNDDYLVPGILTKVAACIEENNNPDIVQCNWSLLSNGTLEENASKRFPTTEKYLELSRIERVLDNIEYFTFPVPFWTRAVELQFLRTCGGGFHFNSRYDGVQDWDGMMQCYMNSDSVFFLNTPMSIHRQRNDSASSATSTKFIVNSLSYLHDWFEIENRFAVTKEQEQLWKEFLANGVARYAINILFNSNPVIIKEVYSLIDKNKEIFPYFKARSWMERISYRWFRKNGCSESLEKMLFLARLKGSLDSIRILFRDRLNRSEAKHDSD